MLKTNLPNSITLPSLLDEKRVLIMKMFAMVTDQGIAAAETFICSACDTPARRDELKAKASNDVPQSPGRFVDVTGNEAEGCQVCGVVLDELGRSISDPPTAEQCA